MNKRIILFLSGLLLLGFACTGKSPEPVKEADQLLKESELVPIAVQADQPNKEVSKPADLIPVAEPVNQSAAQNKPLNKVIAGFINQNNVRLDVPFTSQAPQGDWVLPFKEACEEASILMLHYFKTSKDLNKDVATTEIQALANWLAEVHGDYIHSDAALSARILTDYYGYTADQVELRYDMSLADIKKTLDEGFPVAVPAAGRALGNIYFRQPGPLYHMLVIIGYNEAEQTFITNDPGTRNGKRYVYDQSILFDAIHDFSGDENEIESGRKAMVVLR